MSVFLSYARAGGEERAAALRDRLAREAPDIQILQDRLFLEGGIGWWKQVAQAIDKVEFLILLMTPSAIASGNVQREWRYARRQGVCVYPVKAAPDTELQFGKMPRWMSKAHFYDLDKEFPTFLAHLRKGCDRRRVPFMAPSAPALRRAPRRIPGPQKPAPNPCPQPPRRYHAPPSPPPMPRSRASVPTAAVALNVSFQC